LENVIFSNYNKFSKLTLTQKIKEPLSTCLVKEPLSTHVSAC